MNFPRDFDRRADVCACSGRWFCGRYTGLGHSNLDPNVVFETLELYIYVYISSVPSSTEATGGHGRDIYIYIVRPVVNGGPWRPLEATGGPLEATGCPQFPRTDFGQHT